MAGKRQTRVVFRRFKEGDVIALFPYMPWNAHGNLYAHGTACRGGLCRRDCRDKPRHRGRIPGTAG